MVTKGTSLALKVTQQLVGARAKSTPLRLPGIQTILLQKKHTKYTYLRIPWLRQHPIYMRRNTGIPTYGLRQSILVNKRLQDCYVDAPTLTNIWTSKTCANPNVATKGGPTSSWEVVKNPLVSSSFSLVKLVLRRQLKDKCCAIPPKLGGEGKARKIPKVKTKGTAPGTADPEDEKRESVPEKSKSPSGKLSGMSDVMGSMGPNSEGKESQKEENGAVGEEVQDEAAPQSPPGEGEGTSGEIQGLLLETRSQQYSQDALIIHGLSAERYTALYHSVVEPMLWNTSGTPKRYSLELGKVIKRRLWEALCSQALAPSPAGAGPGSLPSDPIPLGKRSGSKLERDVSEQPAVPKWPKLE
ncbi:uncharacterized protein C22orf31 homolog [Dromiciops gliroides]|uniref:uncharacterized protein C22orf31 homolog n=1 Tax=Dromiciops gliroides TaxID=33562 RepID=UPI001CC6A28F|nr:uncharacterized protein C22orf31 homolog [Dromiciops gliroides]